MLNLLQELGQNICILLALILIYSHIRIIWTKHTLTYRLSTGIVFGLFSIFSMMIPFQYAPGIFCDGRSVILFASGISCGFLGTVTAVLISSIYRIYIGGPGLYTGVYIIICSASIGYMYKIARDICPSCSNVFNTYIAAFIAHLLVLPGTLFLPELIRSSVVRMTFIPAIILCPIASLLFILTIDYQKKYIKQCNESIESKKRLKKTLLQTLSAISKAIEGKDKYTRDHQLRVANFSILVAMEKNWSKHQLIGLFIAALVHDIGKISIPLSILNKVEKLTSEEYEEIKKHCYAGYEIFHQIDYPWPIDEIILQHHERLDGSGYPIGLKGNEISDEAKIIAVCDSFDAMTSDRTYRKRLSKKDALNILRNESGTKYDSEYVSICEKILLNKKLNLLHTPEIFEEDLLNYYEIDEKSFIEFINKKTQHNLYPGNSTFDTGIDTAATS